MSDTGEPGAAEEVERGGPGCDGCGLGVDVGPDPPGEDRAVGSGSEVPAHPESVAAADGRDVLPEGGKGFGQGQAEGDETAFRRGGGVGHVPTLRQMYDLCLRRSGGADR